MYRYPNARNVPLYISTFRELCFDDTLMIQHAVENSIRILKRDKLSFLSASFCAKDALYVYKSEPRGCVKEKERICRFLVSAVVARSPRKSSWLISVMTIAEECRDCCGGSGDGGDNDERTNYWKLPSWQDPAGANCIGAPCYCQFVRREVRQPRYSWNVRNYSIRYARVVCWKIPS